MWDVGLIGAEPQRADAIDFTAAYVEIEATYLVPPGSQLQSIADGGPPRYPHRRTGPQRL